MLGLASEIHLSQATSDKYTSTRRQQAQITPNGFFITVQYSYPYPYQIDNPNLPPEGNATQRNATQHTNNTDNTNMFTSHMVGKALLFAITTGTSTAFVPSLARRSYAINRHISGQSHLWNAASQDTPVELPEFASQGDYLEYLEKVSALPKGFAAGSADGKFVSVEAPSMGALPIRATIITLTEGATDSWAAVFTTNKVSMPDFSTTIMPLLLPLRLSISPLDTNY